MAAEGGSVDLDDSEQWVFDVDGTLVDSLTGTSLRPGSTELLEHLRTTGREVIVWSAGGTEYARDRAREQRIGHLVDRFAAKLDRDEDGHYRIEHLRVTRAVFVDDRPEDLGPEHTILAVSPYLSPWPHDRGLHAATIAAGLGEAPPPRFA